MSGEGIVQRLTLKGDHPRGGVVTIGVMCVGEDAGAWYGFPGDVVYAKDDWELAGLHGTLTLDQAAAELEAAWAAGPGKRFAG